ncbi:MAG TPA: glycosyltransferase family 1 protein [Gemmatimonadales bacterium]|nr:glycosyltransferase family 1 protein [Gemmatimonadales bacterium]
MRIAIFSEVYWPMVSGVSLVLQRLAGALEQRGHAVRVYAPDYTLPAGAGDLRTVHRVPSRSLFLYPDVRWGFPSWPAIRADFADFRPDLVHVATEFSLGTAGVCLARDARIPVVASAHTDYERYSSRYRLDWLMPVGWQYLRWFYGNAARVLCPSKEYQRHLNLRGVRHTGIWSRGIDAELFHPRHRSEAVRVALGIAPGQTMVLYVGRLAAEKGIDLLLEAWRRLEPRRGDARLVFVGTGPLEEAIRNDHIPGVTLAGVRTGRDLAAIYASADLFAFPSSTETFGNVLLEAMASGLPSLAVAAGGVLDFAEHHTNAWLVEPGSPEAMADGLETLLGDPALRARLGESARATALGRDWHSIFDGVVQEYIGIIGEPARTMIAA